MIPLLDSGWVATNSLPPISVEYKQMKFGTDFGWIQSEVSGIKEFIRDVFNTGHLTNSPSRPEAPCSSYRNSAVELFN